MKFNTKNAHEQDIKILYDNTEIPNSSYMKFLGVNIATTLSWKNHTDPLIPKLSSACYAIRAIKPFVNQETLLIVYYAYFHSIILLLSIYANIVPSSPIFATLMMEALHSFETSVLTRATQHKSKNMALFRPT
jgi:hypothetical protein